MTPLVINEDQVFSFKFWFNGVVQTGMYYQTELFCCLGTFDLCERPRVYQLGCQLGQRGMQIALTSSSSGTCSLWGGLRDAAVKELLVNPEGLTLPNLRPAKPEDGRFLEGILNRWGNFSLD